MRDLGTWTEGQRATATQDFALTGAVLGVELFGAPVALYGAIACVMAYLVSGKRGLYAAQRRTGDGPSEAGQ